MNSHGNKIKILFVMRNYQAGGAEVFLLSLLKKFDFSKFSVSIVSIYGGGSLKSAFSALGIETFELQFKGFFDLQSYRQLIRIIKTNGYDIVHTKLFHADIVGRICAGLCRVPVIFSTVENAWEWENNQGVKQKLKNFFFKLTASFNHTIIAVTERISGLLIENVGINNHKIKVIYNGVNPAEFVPGVAEENILRAEANLPTNSILIGAIGSLSPVKNHGMMIRAAAVVLTDRSDIYFFIAGKGNKQELQKLALELEIDDHIFFLGERNDIPKVLWSLDVYAMTSLSEGLSISLLEAMASGKAVIATDVGGNPEIINHSDCGILIPSNDEKALAENILALADDCNQRQKLGIQARKRVLEIFDINVVAKEYSQLYLRTIAQ